tara:strand:- start:1240 stop:1572 length:333 start_codon:yes stop_codon:yes gene_type:complete
MDEELSSQFDKWVEEEGDAIADEIRESMKASSSVLNVNDGSHAVWHEGNLGMLIVVPFEHAMAFAAEHEIGDLENSPVHNYVFNTISELILRATHIMDFTDSPIDEDFLD